MVRMTRLSSLIWLALLLVLDSLSMELKVGSPELILLLDTLFVSKLELISQLLLFGKSTVVSSADWRCTGWSVRVVRGRIRI